MSLLINCVRERVKTILFRKGKWKKLPDRIFLKNNNNVASEILMQNIHITGKNGMGHENQTYSAVSFLFLFSFFQNKDVHFKYILKKPE